MRYHLKNKCLKIEHRCAIWIKERERGREGRRERGERGGEREEGRKGERDSRMWEIFLASAHSSLFGPLSLLFWCVLPTCRYYLGASDHWSQVGKPLRPSPHIHIIFSSSLIFHFYFVFETHGSGCPGTHDLFRPTSHKCPDYRSTPPHPAPCFFYKQESRMVKLLSSGCSAEENQP